MTQDAFTEFKLRQKEMWTSYENTATFTTAPVSISYVQVAANADTSDISLGLLGAEGLDLDLTGLHGGGGHNIVSGVLVYGPVVAGHGLTVKLYQADGVTLLGNTTTLSSSGAFSINVGSYTGVVIAKLEDSGPGNDFRDEATGLSKDLNANLMAVGVSAGGTVTLNINALTTLAASKAGAVFAGANNPAGSISAATVNQTNTAVASVFGLTDLTGTSVVASVNADGTANAAFTPASLNAGVKYGAVLAALSGMDQVNNGDMQATLTALSNGLSVNGSSATLSQSTMNAVVQGAATGNNNLAAILTNLLDIVPPTVLISSSTAALKVGQTATITFTFSEAPIGFDVGDITASNGALSGLTVSADPKVYTAIFTPTSGLTSGNASITIASGAYTDTAGNNGGAGITPAISIDTLPPTVLISSSTAALKVGQTATITFTFSEAVTGFSLADLGAPNATLSNLSSSDGGVTWTATLTPTASTTDATNLITLDNTGVADTSGNSGTGTTTSNNYAVDTVRPTLATSITISDTDLRIGDTATVTFTFTEAVTGFSLADLGAPNATLSNLSSSDGGVTWTATLTPTASTTDATNLITLDNTGVADTSGNSGTGTTNSPNYEVSTSPAIASGTVTISGNLLQGEVLTVSSNISDTNGVQGLNYSWFSSADGISWTNFKVGNSVKLSQSEVGKSIKVTADYSNSVTANKSISSTNTSKVINTNDAPIGVVTVSGTVQEGQVLTTSNNLTDLDGLGTVQYNWQSSSDGKTWANIFSGKTLALNRSEVDQFIRVVADYYDGYATHEIIPSDSFLVSPVWRTNINFVSVIVDKGVLDNDAVLLKDIQELMTWRSGTMVRHTLSYEGLVYQYGQVEKLIMIATRNNEFTPEFTKEINDFLSRDAYINYDVAVSLVGKINIDQEILRVAGSDGNFVM